MLRRWAIINKHTEDQVQEIIRRLQKEYPGAKIALKFSNPLELLVATMLSAQCTDEMVNKVTEKLFQKYRTAADYANANPKELEEYIKPTGFYHNKAKNIILTMRMINEKFNSEVPKTMEELTELPGVARKTANVVLYNAYGITEGIAVDTHVRRLSQRLGLSLSDDPEKIEKDLMRLVPRSEWGPFTYLLIEHGRKVCQAKNPHCRDCVLNDLCPSAFTFKTKDQRGIS